MEKSQLRLQLSIHFVVIPRDTVLSAQPFKFRRLVVAIFSAVCGGSSDTY